jgi:PAS domain S-box-containing protein
VTDAYLRATKTERVAILGKGVFEVFPDNPDDPETKAVDYARASFERVVEHRRVDVMGIRRHDIRRPESEGGGFEERFWEPVNYPVLGAHGQVACIIHRVEDVTESVRLKQEGVERQEANSALRDSRRAAINLMEDAVEARRQAEQASEQLRQEIAEREKAEEALRESAQRLGFHLENTPMAVVEWDARFIVTRWAGEAESIFGWSAAETVGRPIMDLNLIYEEDIPVVEATMARLTDGVSSQVVSSNRNVTKDGRVIDCTWYNSVLLDSDGAMASVMSLVLDNTEHKLLVGDLQDRNQELADQRDKLAERAERLSLLKALAEIGASSFSQAETGRRQIKTLMRMLKTKTAFLFVPDEDGQHLVPHALAGLSRKYLKQHVGPIDVDGEGASAKVFRTGRPAFVRDVESDSSLSESGRAFALSLGQRSGALLPLLVRGEAVGVLALGWAETHALERDEVSFLESVASEVALGLQNARLYDAEVEAQRQAAQERSFLRRILEELPYPVSYIDKGLVYRRTNTAAAATVGLTPEELIGRTVQSVIGADSEVVGLLKGVLKTGEPHSGTIEFKAPGSAKMSHYGVSYVPDKDERGRVVGVLTDVVDVTELVEAQTQVEKELEATTQLLEAAEALAEWRDLGDVVRRLAQTLLRSTSHSRVVVDLWNEARGEIEVVASEGRAPLPLRSRWPIGVVSQAARKAVTERHAQVWDLDALSEAERGSAAVQYQSHLTLYVPLVRREKVVGLLVMDDPGERREFSDREIKFVEGIAAQAAVAIENARLFEDLRSSEGRFGSLFESMAEGVALHELIYEDELAVDYRILDVNASFERQTGIAIQDARGRLASELYGTGDAPYLSEYAQVAEDGRPYAFETYFAPMERHYRITAVSPARGRFATVFEDITDRKQAEEERERLLERERIALQRATDELQATNLLLGAAQSLAESLALAEVLDRLARIILEVTRHTRVTVSLWNDKQDRLEVTSSQGESPVSIGLLVALDELSEPARRAITERATTLIDYDAQEPGRRGVADKVTSHLALDVPLLFGGRFVGLLAIDDPVERHEFGDREIGLIEGIAAEAAVAIENARLYEAELAARRGEAQRTGRLSALKEIADAASSSLDVHEVASCVVDSVLRLLGARQVQLRVVSEDRSVLDSAASVGLPKGFLERLGPIPVDSDVETAVCLRSKEPRIGEDVSASRLSAGSKRHARDAGVRSYVLLPLITSGEAIGTFYVAWAEPRRFESEELSFLEAVAAHSATGLENALLYEAERKAQHRAKVELERTTLLQQVTTAATSSLSLDEIGRVVLTLTTQALGASGAAIYAVDEGQGEVRALALSGYFEEVAHQIAVVPIDEQTSIGRLVVQDLPLITFDSDHIGPASAERARSLGDQDARWLMLPAKRAGRVLGVLGFMFAGERPFEEDELSLYRSIAELLGAALENARLFEEQQRIATTLQDNFIHPLPAVEGLDLGVVSHPAYEPARVGGDFSDVFLLETGQVAILIGDVAGKGVRAAGLTETVRSTVRAFAAIDASPAFVLRKTNELLLRYDPEEPHVTAFLGVLDPHSGHVSFASAGHPAPVHLGPYSCRPLDVSYGPALGAFASDYATAHVILTLEDYLVLYTDGVTEARRDGELFGEERLADVVSSLRGRSAQELADGVRDAALTFAGRLSDDLQVVALRLA